MKKLASLLIVLALVLASALSLASCGKQETLNVGKEYVPYNSQLDTLLALDNGSIDVSIIDSVMAGYYTAQGDYASKIMTVEGLVLATETYGIAGRKEDKSFISAINDALIKLYNEGTYLSVAEQFGLQNTVSITSATTNPLASANDNSLQAIKDSGKMVVGYTVYAPIAYTEGDKFTGFDTEMAKLVAAELGVAVEFQEIDWDTKEALLNNGTIDLIWNGLTITDERSANMCISIPYLYNKQVAVIRKADAGKYTDVASMKDATVGAESGSAGEEVIKGTED